MKRTVKTGRDELGWPLVVSVDDNRLESRVARIEARLERIEGDIRGIRAALGPSLSDKYVREWADYKAKAIAKLEAQREK